jgi:hypothetical protein
LGTEGDTPGWPLSRVLAQRVALGIYFRSWIDLIVLPQSGWC